MLWCIIGIQYIVQSFTLLLVEAQHLRSKFPASRQQTLFGGQNFFDARRAKTKFFFFSPTAGASNVMTHPLLPGQGRATVSVAACDTQIAQITRHSCVHLVLPCISTILPCSLWSEHHANLLLLVVKTSVVAFVWDHCMTVKK